MKNRNQSKELIKLIEPNVKIGEFIERIMKRDGHSNIWLADPERLNCDEKTIRELYKKENIDTEKLVKISLILKYNFFIHYNEYVTQEVLINNYCLCVKDVTDIDMSVVTKEIYIGKMIRQQMNKNGVKLVFLSYNLHRTKTIASKICNRKSLDTYRLFNISILLKLNFFLYYYEYVEKQLHD